MPIYEYRCNRCGKTVEVFAQTAAGIEPPEHCVCGQKGSFSREYSVFAASTAGSGGMDSHECCGGGGGCGCSGSCGCGHHHA